MTTTTTTIAGPQDTHNRTTGGRARLLIGDTRSPGLVVGAGAIDHTQYDTTSIMATIEQRFGADAGATPPAQVDSMGNVFDQRRQHAGAARRHEPGRPKCPVLWTRNSSWRCDLVEKRHNADVSKVRLAGASARILPIPSAHEPVGRPLTLHVVSRCDGPDTVSFSPRLRRRNCALRGGCAQRGGRVTAHFAALSAKRVAGPGSQTCWLGGVMDMGGRA